MPSEATREAIRKALKDKAKSTTKTQALVTTKNMATADRLRNDQEERIREQESNRTRTKSHQEHQIDSAVENLVDEILKRKKHVPTTEEKESKLQSERKTDVDNQREEAEAAEWDSFMALPSTIQAGKRRRNKKLYYEVIHRFWKALKKGEEFSPDDVNAEYKRLFGLASHQSAKQLLLRKKSLKTLASAASPPGSPAHPYTE